MCCKCSWAPAVPLHLSLGFAHLPNPALAGHSPCCQQRFSSNFFTTANLEAVWFTAVGAAAILPFLFFKCQTIFIKALQEYVLAKKHGSFFFFVSAYGCLQPQTFIM